MATAQSFAAAQVLVAAGRGEPLNGAMLACRAARDPRQSGVDRGGQLVERLAADDVRVVGAGRDDERHSVRGTGAAAGAAGPAEGLTGGGGPRARSRLRGRRSVLLIRTDNRGDSGCPLGGFTDPLNATEVGPSSVSTITGQVRILHVNCSPKT
jgi:hypothetical protein